MSTDVVGALNACIEAATPALWAALSPLGRRAAYPPDIPFQSAQARLSAYNATIGQITDGHGQVLALRQVAAALSGLGAEDRNTALLYSPVDGNAELRARWREWSRRGQPEQQPSSLPLVTIGLTHGISLTADLFGGQGRAVAVPSPFWGNYRLAFGVRTGARLLTAPAYRAGCYNCTAIGEALADLPPGEPAVALLNFPSNPGGYSPTMPERVSMRSLLVEIAEARPLVVVCDDAYAGLVFEPDVPTHSMFWDLLDCHPNLVPIKVDGATKEFCLFGGRVGFLTFPFQPDHDVVPALESKAKCILRGTVSSPVSPSQVLLLQALRDDRVAEAIEVVRLTLAERYEVLRQALATVDRDLIVPLPFNSGCFALVELPESLGLTSEVVRRHLLEHYDTGVIALAPNFLRIAFCSITAEAVPELVRRVEMAVRELAA